MRKVVLSAVGAVCAVIGVLAVPGGAYGDTGWYRVVNWSQPTLYLTRSWGNGAVISPPATVPATARITTIDTTYNWNDRPGPIGSFWQYEGRICDTATSTCYSAGSGLGNYWWDTGNSSFAGKPAATTRFYYGVRVNDWSSGSLQLLSPPRYQNAGTVVVYYEY